MGKKVISLLVASFVVALPAVSQAGKGRTASGEYNTIVIAPQDGSPSAEGQISNGVEFKTRPGERFVSLVIEDESGLPTRAVVEQDVDGDGVAETITEICGKSEAPIRFRPGYAVIVAAQDGPCDDGTTAAATFGKVTATFTR